MLKPKFLLIVVLLIVALLIGGFYLISQWQEAEKPLKFLGENSFNIALTTEDGLNLAATYYPSPLSVEDKGVILVHGWGSDRYYWVDFAQKLRDENYEVIIFDLRGHGESEGDYTEYKDKAYRRMFMDIQAAQDYLKSLNQNMQIAVVGQGSGGLSALQSTKQIQDIKSLVLIEPKLEFKGLKAENYIDLFKGPLYLVGTEDKEKLLEKSQSEVKEFKKLDSAEYQLNDLSQEIIDWLKNNSFLSE